MDLHVVGGFLGSGKTTAIVSALHTLIAAGQRVGVITNDKGRFLVDTAFIGSTGGGYGRDPWRLLPVQLR